MPPKPHGYAIFINLQKLLYHEFAQIERLFVQIYDVAKNDLVKPFVTINTKEYYKVLRGIRTNFVRILWA